MIFSAAISKKFTPAYDVMHALFIEMYVAPWVRVLPYLVGVAAGYVMHTLKGELPLTNVSVEQSKFILY